MPQFPITSHIEAPLGRVWEVLAGGNLAADGARTELTLRYSYTLNRLGLSQSGAPCRSGRFHSGSNSVPGRVTLVR